MIKTLDKRISLTLKELRRQRGWSLDKTSAVTGVSKAMLGQIERRESSPTVATLWKIASGFNTSFSSFIENVQTEFNEPIYRVGQEKSLHSAEEKIRVLPLFPFDTQLNLEIFTIELLPTCEHLSSPHNEGVIEHVIVVEGKLEVLVNNLWQTLSTGEGVRFNAHQPHGYRNVTNEIVRFHDIIHYPSI